MKKYLYRGLAASLLLGIGAAAVWGESYTGKNFSGGIVVDFQGNQPITFTLPGGQKYHELEIVGQNRAGCIQIQTTCGSDCSGDNMMWIRRLGDAAWIPLSDDPGASTDQDRMYAKAYLWIEPWSTVEIAMAAYSTGRNNMNFVYGAYAFDTGVTQANCNYVGANSPPSAYVPASGNIIIYGYK